MIHSHDKKLNLGGGQLVEAGWLNVDVTQIVDKDGKNCVDIVHDIEKNGLPFCDNSFDEVKAQSLLEHITDIVFFMNEVHRVLKPNGSFWGNVPPANSDGSLRDPTHVRQFTSSTFDYFTGINNEFPNRPAHPSNADYGILPWNEVSIDEGINFKLTPRKI